MIELEIKGLPPMLLNSRMEWRSKARAANEWYGKTLVALHKNKVQLGQPFPHAFVMYTRWSGSKSPDYHNMTSGFKWIQDALVYAGVLMDDSPEYLTDHYEWRPAKPNKSRVTIWIAPAVKPSSRPRPWRP